MDTDFETHWNHSRANVIRLCRRYTNSSADAEDVQQQIVLRAWRAFASFRGEAQFSTWIYRIAMGEINRFLLKRKREAQVLPLEFAEAEVREPAVPATSQSLKIVLRDALGLREITQLQYAVVLGRLSEQEPSWEEVGKALGVSAARCAIEHARAIPNLTVFLLRYRPELIGGERAILDAWEELKSDAALVLSREEREAFENIILKKDRRYRRVGWQSRLRSACVKLIKHMPSP